MTTHDPDYRYIVCGSRSWWDRQRIADRLAELPPVCTIVHGAARGVDRMAGQEAQKLGLLVEPHPADWKRHGKAAGFIRNEEMADAGAIGCIAFWDRQSSGTLDMMRRCVAHGIPVEVIYKVFEGQTYAMPIRWSEEFHKTRPYYKSIEGNLR